MDNICEVDLMYVARIFGKIATNFMWKTWSVFLIMSLWCWGSMWRCWHLSYWKKGNTADIVSYEIE